MTERELFESQVFIKRLLGYSEFDEHKNEYVYFRFEDYAIRDTCELNTAWKTWQAATQREGFKFVPVDTLDECLSWASVAKWDSPSEERDIEINYHVGIIEAAIGAVGEQ